MAKLSMKPKDISMNIIAEHSMVTTREDRNELPKGSKGAVVHIHGEGAAYEVEFVHQGKNLVWTFTPDQIEEVKA